jgi:hypothetical protein
MGSLLRKFGVRNKDEAVCHEVSYRNIFSLEQRFWIFTCGKHRIEEWSGGRTRNNRYREYRRAKKRIAELMEISIIPKVRFLTGNEFVAHFLAAKCSAIGQDFKMSLRTFLMEI